MTNFDRDRDSEKRQIFTGIKREFRSSFGGFSQYNVKEEIDGKLSIVRKK